MEPGGFLHALRRIFHIDKQQKVGVGLIIGALGVVYGDIGTSPLYSISEAFFGHYPLEHTPENILGVMSLVFWSLMLIVTVKYVLLILRADNNGEGGIFALLGLLMKRERSENASTRLAAMSFWMRSMIIGIIIIGAALLYGDGIITPAISVLSAIEGLTIITPMAKNFGIPVTVIILIVLFALQKKGTHRIGRLFGPIMAVWFLTIAVLGLVQIIKSPFVLQGINPWYAISLAQIHGWKVLFIFGAVVLCVTGVEAMYADLGHFGRQAINRSWLFFVFPCLLLNYFGQGAYLLSGQAVAENHLFYALVPSQLLLPMVVLSTIATIIASQALISGIFSLTQQAIAMGLFPRISILHTNPAIPGQIYLPFINKMLLFGCIWLVLAFKNSSALAAAYGIAVTGTMVVTTLAFSIVAVSVFKWPKSIFLPFVALIFVVDFLFFSANLLKFSAGGYVPIIVGLFVFIIMDTWRWGRQWIGRSYQEHLKQQGSTVESMLEKKRYHIEQSASISLVVMASRPIFSVKDYIPLILTVHYNNWRRLPKHIIFLSLVSLGSPYVTSEDERYKIIPFKQDENGTVISVQVCYGYMEQPNIRKLLHELKEKKLVKIPLDTKRWLILIGAERFVNLGDNILQRLRIGIFSRMNRLAKPFTDYFGLETDPGVTIETINV